MDFVDEVTIHVSSGKGGDGIVAFRREKYVPRGGPAGGDGGSGGDVVLQADAGLNTLVDLRYQTRYRAADGGRGGPNNRSGAHQPPLIIRVPVGTSVYCVEKQHYIADLTYDGQTVVVARGGRGGRGNAAFATPTEQAPKFAELGEPGESWTLRLELRLLADVGVVGFPNCGKSTLIASVSNARPKIGDYPFTTLVPNLGVVRVGPGESFVMADVPGLIEGAHRGAGLGQRFLKHIERTRVLVHLVDCSPASGRDPVSDYEVIRAELQAYSPAVAALPEVIGLNKVDIPEARQRAEEAEKALREKFDRSGASAPPILKMSGATGEGVRELVWAAARLLREAPPRAPVAVEEVVRIEGPEAPFTVERGPSGEFVVSGRQAERLVAMTDLENEQALRRLQTRLSALGVFRELERRGVKHGDTVRVGSFEFEWVDEGAMAGDAGLAEK